MKFHLSVAKLSKKVKRKKPPCSHLPMFGTSVYDHLSSLSVTPTDNARFIGILAGAVLGGQEERPKHFSPPNKKKILLLLLNIGLHDVHSLHCEVLYVFYGEINCLLQCFCTVLSAAALYSGASM